MTTNKIHRYVFSVLVIFLLSCSGKQQKRNSIEKLEVNILVEDTIRKNEKTLIKIFSKYTEWGIAKAYFDCDITSNQYVDTIHWGIAACDKELFVRNDTVLIQLTPTSKGGKKFEAVKILLRGKTTNAYGIIDTTFHYSVW